MGRISDLHEGAHAGDGLGDFALDGGAVAVGRATQAVSDRPERAAGAGQVLGPLVPDRPAVVQALHEQAPQSVGGLPLGIGQDLVLLQAPIAPSRRLGPGAWQVQAVPGVARGPARLHRGPIRRAQAGRADDVGAHAAEA